MYIIDKFLRPAPKSSYKPSTSPCAINEGSESLFTTRPLKTSVMIENISEL